MGRPGQELVKWKELYAMDKNAYLELYKGKFGFLPNQRPVDMNRVMQDVARAKAGGECSAGISSASSLLQAQQKQKQNLNFK